MVKHHLGSIRGWFLPTADSEVAMQQFTPYGTRVLIDSTFPNPLPSYGWTRREYDAETGFYYLRARYYDPTELRFIQEDPSGYGGGPNVYAYVGGAVLSATDPSGMLPSPDGAYKMDGYIYAGLGTDLVDDFTMLPGTEWCQIDKCAEEYVDRLMDRLVDLTGAFHDYQEEYDQLVARLAGALRRAPDGAQDAAILADAQKLNYDQFRALWVSTAATTDIWIAQLMETRLLEGEVGVGDLGSAEEPGGLAQNWAASVPISLVGEVFPIVLTEIRSAAFSQSWIVGLEIHETMHAYYDYLGEHLTEGQVCRAGHLEGGLGRTFPCDETAR